MSLRYLTRPFVPPTLQESSDLIATIDIRRIGWDDLRVLLFVAECGSFRSGATMARVSLNTARVAIRRLERVFGEPLFIRSIRGVILTERGQKLVAAANQMRDAIRDTLR